MSEKPLQVQGNQFMKAIGIHNPTTWVEYVVERDYSAGESEQCT